MLEPPFVITYCSWPRPVVQANNTWLSEPDWDAPEMHFRPQPYWEMVDDSLCWMINWQRFFRRGIRYSTNELGGEMKNFHVIFHLKITGSGQLIFWDDDGSIVRRNGEIVHRDPSAHPLTHHEIEVSSGDRLEIAHWQLHGEWLWGARIEPHDQAPLSIDSLEPYREQVEQRLHCPDGPPLKIYIQGSTPIRTIVAIFSLILNGYSPSEVHLFGEHQWSPASRELFQRFFPFARFVPTDEVVRRLQSVGGAGLVSMAKRYWFVMKTCVSLLCPPNEFCLMDDDVFILDHLEDALEAFHNNDFVFAPDTNHGKDYTALWGWIRAVTNSPTANFNAGLYWLRNGDDQHRLATMMLRVSPGGRASWHWEQGFIATINAHKNIVSLPAYRYFYPLFDGLPGGVFGYDYARNPCGFASIHFGGLPQKPPDTAVLLLAPHILGRATHDDRVGSGAKPQPERELI